MNPEQMPENEKLQSVENPLKVMQQGERVICEVKRHPVGLWGIYFGVLILLIVLITGAIVVPGYIPNVTDSTRQVFAIGAVLIAAVALLYTYVARIVYTGNRWVVTSDSLTQITQVSLFRKQSSQLSLANLEDVTVDQNGLFQAMVGYGTLKVETAGERSKFVFPFCPSPNKCAKEIIAAHEAYIAENPSETYTSQRALANAASFNQAYAPPQQQPQPGPQAMQAPYDPTLQQQQPRASTPAPEPPQDPTGSNQQ